MIRFAERGETVLHRAAYNKGPVEFFIELGADVKAKNKKDETPLHKACNSLIGNGLKLQSIIMNEEMNDEF